MNENLKLEDRNVNNTHPIELKRLRNKNFDKVEKNLKNKKKFSIVSFIFFALISIMMYVNPIIVDAEYSIIPSVIAFAFSLVVMICELYIKDNLIHRKITNSILEDYENEK